MTQRYPWVELQCAQFAAAEEDKLRTMVKAAGALWVGIQDGSPRGRMILFQSGPGQSTLSLYLSALKTIADVEMAVKAYTDKKELVKVDGL